MYWLNNGDDGSGERGRVLGNVSRRDGETGYG